MQSNFGAGYNNLNIRSKPNFTENNISPSPKSQILGSSTLPQGEGDLDRENNISPSPNLQANSTLPQGEGDKIEEGHKIEEGDLDRGGDGAEYIPRIDVEKNYPAIFAFLQKFQNQLEKRTDKGDHWTNLRNCAYLEEFEKEKIVWNRISSETVFSYDSTADFYILDSMFFITGKDIKYLISIINSAFSKFYIKQVSATIGNGTYAAGIYIKQLPIPQIPVVSQAPFIAIVNEILSITSQPDYNPSYPKIRQKELEKQIDEMVCDLYQLTEQEKNFILQCN